ncbi:MULTISPECIES: DUF4328 domain-containing protein [Kitasatospora]|uniref:DUF4328 domain-containing protein n=1 Tax=Kitasatospora cathayae TaxID=3004092 RepID=A0ABY7QAP9_9ACTN|nr:DUF4328 domain-containing protein [Kitasatospora sp. HUAS 3-15]WBP89606.1 DUF4328 domain-containing protein [Kitasatospora sp. HUAS 3-15]
MPSPAVFRSPKAAATAATVLLSVSGAASLFRLAVDVRLYGLVGDLLTNIDLVDDATIADADHLDQAASTVALVALVATAAAFITWFYRVRVNAEVLNPHGHRFRRGWAIGGWFTPLVALWFPRQIAGDIWQAGARPDESGVRPPLSQTPLNLWWTTFVVGNVLGRIGAQSTNAAHYPDDYQQGVVWLIASDLLELAAAVFAVLVVRKVTSMQEERFAESAARAYGVGVSAVGS